MAEKNVKGRKRHIVTDTQGHPLAIMVHPANENDGMKGCDVFEQAVNRYPSIEGVCADGGYRGTFVGYVSEMFCVAVDIVLSIPKTFQILPKRWVVERSFAWLNGFRRLSKDYEILTDSAVALVQLAFSHLFLKKLNL